MLKKKGSQKKISSRLSEKSEGENEDFFDTNILISAYYFKGKERKSILKITHSDHTPVISTQVVSELQKIMGNKFDEKEDNIEDFLERLLSDFKLVRDYNLDVEIQDEADKSIIGSAVNSDCDFLVTGDKGIHECKIEGLRIVNTDELLKEIK